MAKKHATKKTLIVDIGTAVVSAGLVTESKHNAPLVFKVERVPVGMGAELSADALLTHTGSALKTLFEKFAKEGPKEIRIILGAPWHESRIRTVASGAEKATAISEKTILKAVTDYKNEKPPATGQTDVEAVAVAVAVNGYGTRLAKPVMGKRLKVNVYESEVDLSLEKHIRESVQKFFPHAALSYNTFPLVATVALRGISSETSFIIVDCAGEMTEVAILHEDSVQHLSSFPLGYYSIARALPPKGTPVGDSLSRLALYVREELSAPEQAKVDEQFVKAFEAWKEAFEEVLHKASETTPIPQTVFLISDKEQLAWIKKGFEASNTFALTIRPVTAPMVQNIVEIGEQATYDIFLSLGALFFHIASRELIGE